MNKSKEYLLPVAVHVGELLREWLDEHKMSGKEFAIRTGKPEKTISNILNGKSAVTKETAIAFEIVTGIPAEYILRFQAKYDEAVARLEQINPMKRLWDEWGSLFPYADMAKCGWVKPTRKPIEKMDNILRFFKVTQEYAFDKQYANNLCGVKFRALGKSNRTSYAVSAWIRQGEILANEIEVGEFQREKIEEYIPLLKESSCKKDFDRVINLCAEMGIKLVFVQNIPRASISGAVKWLAKTPIIMLSGKGKSLDKLVFNFFHELGHIHLNHCNDTIFVDDIDEISDVKEEKEADNYANNVLFGRLKEFQKKPNVQEVKNEARRIGIHPCMIVGHLTHNKIISYQDANSYYKSLLCPIELNFDTKANICD